jgi:hypothetical protein
MRSRNLPSLRSLLLTVTALVGAFVCPPRAAAQTFFYSEVAKDGRIYVFAVASRYDAFVKTDGKDIGTVITRPRYGPNGETVVFDSQNAINLYNFKHGLPGEQFPQAQENPEPKFPFGKLSGLLFGDFYWYYKWHQDQISSTDTTSVQGQQGFWFRRIYFTYDWTYSEKVTTRFRLEANSNGQFAGGNITPYVKDAYLRWTYGGKHQLTLGIQPSLTFDWLDGFWGLRHIEKSPADLYRIDSSRDFGLTSGGPLANDGLRYAVQLGNESGQGSEGQKGMILRLEGRFEGSNGVALEGFYSYGRRRPLGDNRQTVQGIGGVRKELGRVGAQYLWQERKSGRDDLPDQTIAIWSGFAVWDIGPRKADVFFRADGVKGDLGGVETGLPGADGIDYWLLSPNSKFTMWIVGGEWYLHPAIRLGPNLELVKYANDPDPLNFPGRDQDSILRFTFFWTF